MDLSSLKKTAKGFLDTAKKKVDEGVKFVQDSKELKTKGESLFNEISSYYVSTKRLYSSFVESQKTNTLSQEKIKEIKKTATDLLNKIQKLIPTYSDVLKKFSKITGIKEEKAEAFVQNIVKEIKDFIKKLGEYEVVVQKKKTEDTLKTKKTSTKKSTVSKGSTSNKKNKTVTK